MTNSNSTFTYDKDNNLVSVVSSPQTTTYVWDEADYLTEETGGAISVQYSTMNSQLVEEDRGGVVTDYVPDTLGSVIKTTNSSGTVTSSSTFWPYGETNASTGTNPSNFGFVGTWGYYTDSIPTTGTQPPIPARIYIRARSYRPDLSRWLTVDPLWPKALSYLVFSDSPLQVADPSGEFGGSSWLGAGVTVCAYDDCFYNMVSSESKPKSPYFSCVICSRTSWDSKHCQNLSGKILPPRVRKQIRDVINYLKDPLFPGKPCSDSTSDPEAFCLVIGCQIGSITRLSNFSDITSAGQLECIKECKEAIGKVGFGPNGSVTYTQALKGLSACMVDGSKGKIEPLEILKDLLQHTWEDM